MEEITTSTTSMREQVLGTLQETGKYWGKDGAIRLGKKTYGGDLESPHKDKKLHAVMGLISLYYCAASLAEAHATKTVWWAKPFWLMRSLISLAHAWKYCVKAQGLSTIHGYHFSSKDWSVIHSVAEQCAKHCPAFISGLGFEKNFKEFAEHAQTKGRRILQNATT